MAEGVILLHAEKRSPTALQSFSYLFQCLGVQTKVLAVGRQTASDVVPLVTVGIPGDSEVNVFDAVVLKRARKAVEAEALAGPASH